MEARQQKIAFALLLVPLAGLVVTNFMLVRQNANLKARMGALSLQLGQALDVTKGTLLPPLSGLDSRGAPLRINYSADARKTLLLVFSTSCPACDDNWPIWNRFLPNVDEQSVRVVAVNLSRILTREYIERFGLEGLTVLADIDEQSQKAHRLNRTPQTILVDEGGVVVGVWTGLLTNANQRDIKELTEPLNEPTS